MSPFLSLANELIQLIGDELGPERKTLRSVCKRFNYCIESQVLSHLVLTFNCHRIPENLGHLRALAAKNEACSAYTRTLEVRSLAPGYDPDITGKRIIYHDDGTYEFEERPKPTEEVRKAEKELASLIAPAINSIESLRKFVWTMRDRDPAGVYASIIRSLLAQSTLEELHLNIRRSCLPPLNWHLFKNLRTLVLMGSCFEYRPAIVWGLGQAIARSPHLLHLEVDSGLYWNRADNPPTLHDLLGQTRRPLELEYLSLRGWAVEVDEVIIPHLRALKTLRLLNQIGLTDEDELPCTPIWRALQREKIHLKSITTDVVEYALMDYLASYVGVQELHFAYVVSFRRISAYGTSERFWTECLPLHVKSLQSLTIRPGLECRWCYDERCAPILAKCTQLRELSLCLSYNNIRNDTGLHLLKAARDIPTLEKLSISPPNIEIDPSTMQHGFSLAIDEMIRRHEASEDSPPVICNGPREYKVASEPRSGSLRYERIVPPGTLAPDY
ncbi:hypothetical protein AX16_005845 [Volvariella volvacea WC 439]|nr:hypothetical protein AX16_005845 [Volvariella volvacea WC 439]